MGKGKKEMLLTYIEGLNFSSNMESMKNAVESIFTYAEEIGYNITDKKISDIINSSKKLLNMIDTLSLNVDLETLDSNSNIYRLINSYFEILEESEAEDITNDMDIDKDYKDSVSNYFDDIKQFKLLNSDEEVELFKRMNNGDEKARTEIINRNLRLVIKIAKRYAKQSLTMPLEDLIQEGNIGLMKAVSMFDHSKGFKFSTYATFWIRQSIARAINSKAREIKRPVHQEEKILKIYKASAEFAIKSGRQITIKELADELNLSEKTISTLLVASAPLPHLESPVKSDDGEDTEFGEFIPDLSDDYEKLEDMILIELIMDTAKNAKGSKRLNEREELVIAKRFGLGNTEKQTLEGIASDLELTRERIRQIEVSGLAKIVMAATKVCPDIDFSNNEILLKYNERKEKINQYERKKALSRKIG